MLYYILAASIPEGIRSGPNVFTTATTSDGRRVCAKAAVDEFPELFYGQELRLVALTCADFPAPAACDCI